MIYVIIEKMEDWKLIDGYDYFISNFGLVENAKTGRILQPGIDGEGYYTVVLSKDKKRKTHTIHRLVANAFIENSENKYCVEYQ